MFFSIVTRAQVNLPSPYGYFTPVDVNLNPVYPTRPSLDIYGIEMRKKSQEMSERFIQEYFQSEKLKKERLQQFSKQNAAYDNTINYGFPSLSNQKGTEYYRTVFDKMLEVNAADYSVRDINFLIENAFNEESLNKEEFDKTIKQIGEFLTAKMKESKYDLNSNTAKNFMLFEFFTQTLEVRGFKEKHFPIKYDFEDYKGEKDWQKMFVTKLLKTGTGQCHSMPLLYLILAEEINAEAYLALSPNHSYIKFQDEKEKWHNLELTNGMFTVSSFILNSGFIKAEAIQNHIYMENLSKQQLLSNFYVDLALGYIEKFGYDEFVEKTANKALELYPKSINANILLSNFYIFRFEYAAKKLGINPVDNKDLQRIAQYPTAVKWLNAANNQRQKIDALGYYPIPDEAYENWLHSLQNAKSKQDNETFKKQFKGAVKKTKD